MANDNLVSRQVDSREVRIEVLVLLFAKVY